MNESENAKSGETRLPADALKTNKMGRKFGIRSIVIYKLCKAVLCLAIAIGFFSISKMDIGDFEDMIIGYFHIDTESRLWINLVYQIEKLTSLRIQIIEDGFVILSSLNFIEALGLVLQRKWGVYMVIVEDLIFIPFEIYELYRRASVHIFIILIVNVLIAVYLLKHWIMFNMPASILKNS